MAKDRRRRMKHMQSGGDLGHDHCKACGKRHAIVSNNWVILASGAFVCHNDECWRVLANWYKEKDDAKRMD